MNHIVKEIECVYNKYYNWFQLLPRVAKKITNLQPQFIFKEKKNTQYSNQTIIIIISNSSQGELSKKKKKLSTL